MTVKIWLTCSLVCFVFVLIGGGYYLRTNKRGKLWHVFLPLIILSLLGPVGVVVCVFGFFAYTIEEADSIKGRIAGWLDKTKLGTNPFYKLSREEQKRKYKDV